MSEYWISIPHWGMFCVTQEEFYSMRKHGAVLDDNVLYLFPPDRKG